MTPVYLLWHTHDLGDGDTDDKLMGVYATGADATQTLARSSVLPRFCEAVEGFSVHPRVNGRDDWRSGYSLETYRADGA